MSIHVLNCAQQQTMHCTLPSHTMKTMQGCMARAAANTADSIFSLSPLHLDNRALGVMHSSRRPASAAAWVRCYNGMPSPNFLPTEQEALIMCSISNGSKPRLWQLHAEMNSDCAADEFGIQLHEQAPEYGGLLPMNPHCVITA